MSDAVHFELRKADGRPIDNRPQVANLPHMPAKCSGCVALPVFVFDAGDFHGGGDA